MRIARGKVRVREAQEALGESSLWRGREKIQSKAERGRPLSSSPSVRPAFMAFWAGEVAQWGGALAMKV